MSGSQGSKSLLDDSTGPTATSVFDCYSRKQLQDVIISRDFLNVVLEIIFFYISFAMSDATPVLAIEVTWHID